MSAFSARLWLVLFMVSLCGCGVMSQQQNVQGVQYYQQGNLTGAIESFRKSIENDPQHPDGYYNLAAAQHQLAKARQAPAELAQAEQYYLQALAKDPNHADARRGLAVLYCDQGRANNAFSMLTEWAQQSPTRADPFVELARLSEEFGDKESAKQRLIQAVAAAPSNSRALAALGRLREEAGDLEQAAANYARALAVNSQQPELAARLAQIQAARPPANTWPAYPQNPDTRLATPNWSTLR